jgi:hypothetical protein
MTSRFNLVMAATSMVAFVSLCAAFPAGSQSPAAATSHPLPAVEVAPSQMNYRPLGVPAWAKRSGGTLKPVIDSTVYHPVIVETRSHRNEDGTISIECIHEAGDSHEIGSDASHSHRMNHRRGVE